MLQRAPEHYALTFEVAGRCDDCSTDERVDLTVRPLTATSGYLGRAVKEAVGGKWSAEVFVGDNRGNPLAEGDRLEIEAIVLREIDLIIFEGRKPRPPPQIHGRAVATVVVRGLP